MNTKKRLHMINAKSAQRFSKKVVKGESG